MLTISIHAPRTGSDRSDASPIDSSIISIYAPRTGSDPPISRGRSHHGGFQSTLPARGATDATPSLTAPCKNFNPRSPHGERRRKSFCRCRSRLISIHAPRTGSDAWFRGLRLPRSQDFNPRSPHGERHVPPPRVAPISAISIHAPRTGSDVFILTLCLCIKHFNPRSPHGERLARSASPAM